ncbi:hypothetical protein J3F83DRAFT_745560 [Trichoderma novae-zelandiae]
MGAFVMSGGGGHCCWASIGLDLTVLWSFFSLLACAAVQYCANSRSVLRKRGIESLLIKPNPTPNLCVLWRKGRRPAGPISLAILLRQKIDERRRKRQCDS